MINDPSGSGDPWLQAYRQASEQDPRRPNPSVGDAVRAHARMLAQPQADQSPVSPEPDRRAGEAANAGSWRWSMLGGLAVIGLVGLLVVLK